MTPRVALGIALAVFVAGLATLLGALALRPSPRVPAPLEAPEAGVRADASVGTPPQITATPVPSTAPPPTTAAPAPPVVVAPNPTAPPPAAAPPGAPPPQVAPPPAPAPVPEPMRPKLGLSLNDTSLLQSPIEVGPGSVGIAERSPKVAGIAGGLPAAPPLIKVGDHVYAVDGKSVDSVADFEAMFRGKTAPGEVVLRVGPTRSEAHDVKLVVK
jgi:hypothetical protein